MTRRQPTGGASVTRIRWLAGLVALGVAGSVGDVARAVSPGSNPAFDLVQGSLAGAQRPPAGGQDAGVLAVWQDRQIKAVYDPVTQVTDVTLALLPPSYSGAPSVTLTFHASFQGRAASELLRHVEVRAHAGPLSDARVVRTTSLAVRTNPGTWEERPFEFAGSAWGYGGFTPPGDQLPLVRFTVPLFDLIEVSAAAAAEGEVLGFPFVLTPAQLAAMRGFVAMIMPEASGPGSDGRGRRGA